MNNDEIREILDAVDENLVNKFIEFHNNNPHVFKKFSELSEQMLSSGKGHYGARTIVEIIRWEHDLTTKGDVFKFNNDFSPLYARLLMAQDKRFNEFFQLRKMKPVRQTSWEELRRQGLVD